MLKSTLESVSREKMNIKYPTRVAGVMKQQQGDGADGQLQRTVWDSSGFQQ